MINLEVYSDIGFWGLTSSDVAEALKDSTEDVTIRCSSYGGDAYEGIAIANLLQAHPGKVTGIVEGVAASAASIVMIGGCDHLIVRPSAEIMIHDAWTYTEGNGEDLEKTARDLDRLSNNLAGIYATKAGGNVEYWRELMRAETWFNADEAITAGLADEKLAGNEEATASSRSRMYAKLKFIDRAHAQKSIGENMGDLNKELAERLGVSDSTDAKVLLAALDEALAERAEEPTEEVEEAPVAEVEESTEEPTDVEGETQSEEETEEEETAEVEETEEPTEEETKVEPAKAQAPQNLTVTIDVAALEELRAQAAYGVQAKAREDAQAREKIVDTAIRENRISSAARERWLTAMEVDPEGTKAELARIPKDLIPRAEIGHSAPETKIRAPRGFGSVQV